MRENGNANGKGNENENESGSESGSGKGNESVHARGERMDGQEIPDDPPTGTGEIGILVPSFLGEAANDRPFEDSPHPDDRSTDLPLFAVHRNALLRKGSPNDRRSSERSPPRERPGGVKVFVKDRLESAKPKDANEKKSAPPSRAPSPPAQVNSTRASPDPAASPLPTLSTLSTGPGPALLFRQLRAGRIAPPFSGEPSPVPSRAGTPPASTGAPTLPTVPTVPVSTPASAASAANKSTHTPLFRKVVVAREEEAGVQATVSKRKRKRKNKDGTTSNAVGGVVELTVVEGTSSSAATKSGELPHDDTSDVEVEVEDDVDGDEYEGEGGDGEDGDYEEAVDGGDDTADEADATDVVARSLLESAVSEGRYITASEISEVGAIQASTLLTQYLSSRRYQHDPNRNPYEDPELGFLAFASRALGLLGPSFVGIAVASRALRYPGLRLRVPQVPHSLERSSHGVPSGGLWSTWQADHGALGETWTEVVECLIGDAGEAGVVLWDEECAIQPERVSLTDAATLEPVMIKHEPGTEIAELLTPMDYGMESQDSKKWKHGYCKGNKGNAAKLWMIEGTLEKAARTLDGVVDGGGAWLLESYNALPTSSLDRLLLFLSSRRSPPDHPASRALVQLAIVFLRLWSDPSTQQGVSDLVIARLRPSRHDLEWIQSTAKALVAAKTDQEVFETITGGNGWGEEEVRRLHLAAEMAMIAAICGIPLGPSQVVTGAEIGEHLNVSGRLDIETVTRTINHILAANEITGGNGREVPLAILEKKILSEFRVGKFETLGLEGCPSLIEFLGKYMGVEMNAFRLNNGASESRSPDTKLTSGMKSLRVDMMETSDSSLKVLHLKDLIDLADGQDSLAIVRHLSSAGVNVPDSLDPALLHFTRPELDLFGFSWQCAHFGGFLDDAGNIKKDKREVLFAVLNDAYRAQYGIGGPRDLGLRSSCSWVDVTEGAIEWKRNVEGSKKGSFRSQNGVYETALFCSEDLRHLLPGSQAGLWRAAEFRDVTTGLIGNLPSLWKPLPAVGDVRKFHSSLIECNALDAAKEAAALFVQRHSGARDKVGGGDLLAMAMATKDFVAKVDEDTSRIVLVNLKNELPNWMREEFVESVLNKAVPRVKWREWTVPVKKDSGPQNAFGNMKMREQEHHKQEVLLSRPSETQLKVKEVPSVSEKDPRTVVEDIRRTEFGIGVEDASPEVELVLKNQRERVERAMKRLGTELYTSDSHFALELIQNADDNRYDRLQSELPSIQFILTPTAIVIRNNEDGFSATDMRSLCDVGRSTKE
ncbi:hypothetical protein M427DRAFT_65839, partial [Gonapodya prolifera JEL478]